MRLSTYEYKEFYIMVVIFNVVTSKRKIKKGALNMINVTNLAVEKFKEILKQENQEDAYIRIYVSGTG